LLGALSYSKIENRFRNRGKSGRTSFKAFSAATALTLVIPLALFATIDKANKENYWGLNKNLPRPPYAGELDPNCSRASKAGPPCSYTNAGATKTVLLIGDSHAGHISQAVIEAAKNTDWNSVIWTHGGCRVIFQARDKTGLPPNCIENNDVMKKWVLKNKPDAIIVSEYILKEFSQAEFKNALTILHSLVPNILLIENNPVFPDRKDFMVERPLVMSPYKPPKFFKRSEMNRKDSSASNQLAKWARNKGISTMNFEPLFCNTKICSRYSSAGWLYLDDDHLSVVGAELTVPQLGDYLDRL
jgi:hypothetical protein